MSLSYAFDLAYGPATVSQLGYQSPIGAASAMRGPIPVSVQVGNAGVSAALPAGKRLFMGLKLSSALKGNWLTLCELTQPIGSAPNGPYTGTLNLNAAPIRSAVHADPTDPAAELPSLVCLAEHFYTDADGVNNAVPAQNIFTFTVGSPLPTGTEDVPPNANTPYATIAALTPLLNLYAAGMLLLAPQSLDFSQSRNASLLAAL